MDDFSRIRTRRVDKVISGCSLAALRERWDGLLDVARYATRMLDELAFATWRYRTRGKRSMRKAFDQFSSSKSGDLLPPSEDHTATVSSRRCAGVAEPDMQKLEMTSSRADRHRRKAFMGMTLGCVRCHDHSSIPSSRGLLRDGRDLRTAQPFPEKRVIKLYEHCWPPRAARGEKKFDDALKAKKAEVTGIVPRRERGEPWCNSTRRNISPPAGARAPDLVDVQPWPRPANSSAMCQLPPVLDLHPDCVFRRGANPANAIADGVGQHYQPLFTERSPQRKARLRSLNDAKGFLTYRKDADARCPTLAKSRDERGSREVRRTGRTCRNHERGG